MLLIRAAYRMRHQTTKISRRSPLVSILAITFFLCAFGFIAQEVSGGKTSAFDRRVILALRNSADPSVLFGPAWLQEAARDVTSLGGIVVLAIITLAAVGYLFLARKQVAAWLMLIAVFGGIALNDLLKAAFARPRPDIVNSCGAGFHDKFPKRPCRTVCDHLFDGGRSSRSKSVLIQDGHLLHVAGGISDRAYRHKPNIPWGSLSNRRSRRLVHRCGLGHRVLDDRGKATNQRSD